MEISPVHMEEEGKAIHLRRNKNFIDDHSSFLQKLPLGYRFRPEDHQLIQSFLRKKVLNYELPDNRIYDVNLYDYNPDDLARHCEPWGDEEWYFFTLRESRCPNGNERPAGEDGFWKDTGDDENILDSDDRVIGARKAFVFHSGKQAGKSTETNWSMHEYSIHGLEEKPRTENNNTRLDDWVLCKVYKMKPVGDDTGYNTGDDTGYNTGDDENLEDHH